MMNLSEFLENWDVNTQIVVETNTKEIFCGKVTDMSEDVACRYWIPKAGVKHNKEIMHITVEHEGEVKAIDFSEQTKRESTKMER